MGLKRDLLRVSGSNLIVLVSSVINGFLLPSVLSIDSFANYKTYTLYVGFVGFLHLGFVDGINIKYGGKEEIEVDIIEFNLYHKFFLLFQSLVVFVVLTLGFVIKDNFLLLLALSILPLNLQSLFLFYYQAIRKFKIYSKGVIFAPLTSIVITISLIFLGVKQYNYYVFSSIIGYIGSVIFMEFFHYKTHGFGSHNIIKNEEPKTLFNDSIKQIFISGFFIMTGNILFKLFFDSGKWMAKIYTDNEGFAQFSLGISLIGFILFFINTINKTFYPYLYHNFSDEVVDKYKKILTVIGSFSLVGFFVLKKIVVTFLPKYEEALFITAILITSIPGMMVIRSLYVNYYKIKKRELKFVIDSLFFLSISIVINITFFYCVGGLKGIAMSSVLSIYIWTFFPKGIQKKKIPNVVYELVYYLIVFFVFFYLVELELNLFISFILMLIFLIIINFVFYRDVIKNLLKSLIKKQN